MFHLHSFRSEYIIIVMSIEIIFSEDILTGKKVRSAIHYNHLTVEF